MNKLQLWRVQRRMSRKDFAAELGVAVSTVGRYENGELLPIWPVMLRIIAVTKGKVRPNNFTPVRTE